MNRLNVFIEHIVPLIKNIFLPAALFAGGIFAFYAYGYFPSAALHTIHSLFFILCFMSLLTLLYFNQSKAAFSILLLALSYVLINNFKNIYGSDGLTSDNYLNLCIFLPVNFIIFYFIPNGRLLTKRSVYLLLLILCQFSAGEFLGRHNLSFNLAWNNGYIGSLPVSGFITYTAALLTIFILLAEKGHIIDYALFFTLLNTFFGLIYAESTTAFSLFFCLAALTLLCGIAFDIHHNIYKDTLTELSSRYAFMINSAHFPLKYSLGLISIDDYERLASIFGTRERNNLLRMIVNRILEEENEENIYRYTDGELVVLYKNQNKNESFQFLEKIRRTIASADFILNNRNKAVKLTVSTCVSEKKRSDANSMEVLYRARKVLQKANEFSHNISHKA